MKRPMQKKDDEKYYPSLLRDFLIESDTYAISGDCTNCGKKTVIKLKKGTPYSGPYPCPHCGCKTVIKSYQQ